MFNKNYYNKFVKINDCTYGAVIEEGAQKLDKIINLCDTKNLCVQAGSNFGIFPHYISTFFNQVLTFEPSKILYDMSVVNLKSCNNIKLLNAGLFEKKCTGTMHFDKQNCGASYMSTLSGDTDLVTIDSIMEDYNDCNLIYLDIEGMEYQALLGAKKTINKYKPVIVIENKGINKEISPDLIKNNVQKLFNYKYIDRLMRDDIFIPL
ncbi:FkbM family methyltransferase, partial [archaeon]|nr:FkbM family methyltransferase [archaeon]